MKSYLRRNKIKRVGFVITSSRPNAKRIRRSIASLEERGIEVILSGLLYTYLEEYPDGNFTDPEYMLPEDRAEDLFQMLKIQPDLIVAATGGYGAGKLAPLLDSSVIRDYGVPFMGFSDPTFLVNLWAIYGVNAWVGPCAEEYEYLARAIEIIEKHEPIRIHLRNMEFFNFKNSNFETKGLAGGSLTCLTTLATNPDINLYFQQDITTFLVEDIYPPDGYRDLGAKWTFEAELDRVEIAGLSDKIFLWGTISGVRNANEIIRSYFKRKGPFVINVPFGHEGGNCYRPIPVGSSILVAFDTTQKTILIHPPPSP